MRPIFINVLASLAAIIVLPFVLIAVPSPDLSGLLWSSQPSQTSFNRFENPFGNPYYRQAPPPRQLTRAERIERNVSQCISSYRGTQAQPDFVQPVCQCTAPAQVDLSSNNERNEAGKRCRAQILENLSRRGDLLNQFDQVFGQICNGKFLSREGRIDDQRAQPVCACMAKRIRSNPLRAAAFAFADGEVSKKGGWEDQLAADSDQCVSGSDVFKSDGWRVETRNGTRLAVLRMPEHHDLEEIQLGCGYSGMYMKQKYWANSKYIRTLKYEEEMGDGSWELNFNANVAEGAQVVDFYRYMLDNIEGFASQSLDNSAENYSLAIPDPNNNRTIEVHSGDFRNVIPAALGSCLPASPNKIYPAPAQNAGVPSATLGDYWKYAGRSANYRLPEDYYQNAQKGANGDPMLTLLAFSCQKQPTLRLAGGFATEQDQDKLPSRLRITPIPNGSSMSLPLACAPAEGGIGCEIHPTQAQFETIAGAPAIHIETDKHKIADVVFGKSLELRKAFSYCVFPSSNTQKSQTLASVPVKAPTPNIAPQAALPPASAPPPTSAAGPEVIVGSRHVLTGVLNLRAFPANDGRRLRELAVGTELTVRSKTQDHDGAWWSAVAINGQDAGYVKDSALARNTRPGSPDVQRVPQIEAISRSETTPAKPSQQTCVSDLAKISADHERASQEFNRSYRASFVESESMQVRCRLIQIYIKSSERLINTAKKCPSTDRSRAIIDKQNSEIAAIKRPAQSLGCNM